jgi:hypothetical protein
MTNADRNETAATRSHNRIAAIMMHTDRRSFRGTSRLAADTGPCNSTISHLVRGTSGSLLVTLGRVTKVLVAQLGCLLDKQEVVAATDSYPIKERLRQLPLLPATRSVIASIEKDNDAPVYAEE